MTPTLDLPDALPELHCDLTWRSAARVPLRAPWYVRRVELVEHLDAPFVLRLQIDSDELDLDVLDLVGGELTVTLARDASTPRRIHGVVLRSELVGMFAARIEFSLEVGPAVALAGLGARTRIFQRLTVPEIAAAVLGPTLSPLRRGVELRLARHPPVRDCVVQWRESDLDFVLRILADAGIGCVFEHGDEVESFVLVDDVAALRGVGVDDDGDPGPTTVPLVGDDGTVPRHERVAVLAPTRTATPLRFDAVGWDWKQRPPTLLESSDRIAPAAWPEAVLEDPGTRRLPELPGPAHADETLAHARGAKAEAAAAAAKVAGWGDVLSFTPGRTFELTGHPCVQHDASYLLRRVVHRASFPRSDEPGSGGRARYFNEFVAHPLELGHAPTRRPRPRADGLHSAIVVGPPGEEIHTDAHGRIQVRFPWDREPPADDDGARCWLRCVQPWAGAGFGTMFVPRVGMEVLVAFVDGDPDRPVAVGCVYNGGAEPPHPLPEHRTRTGIRTASSPGGAGHNELYFDDAAGHEEVVLHAQRDLRERVRADRSTRIDGNRTQSIGAHQTTRVGGNTSASIGGDASTVVGGALSVAVAGAHASVVGGPRTASIGAPDGVAVHDTTLVHGAQRVVVDREVELSGNDGAHLLVMTDAAVALSHGPGGPPTSRPAATDILEIGEQGIVLRAAARITLAVGASTLVIDAEGIHGTTPAGKRIDLAVGSDAGLELTCDATLRSGAASVHLASATAAMRAPVAVVHGDESVRLDSDAACDVHGATMSVTGTSITIHGDSTTTVRGGTTEVADGAGGIIKIAAGIIDLN